MNGREPQPAPRWFVNGAAGLVLGMLGFVAVLACYAAWSAIVGC